MQTRMIELLCMLSTLFLGTLELTMESRPEGNYILMHLGTGPRKRV
jgi:hypothetical protein